MYCISLTLISVYNLRVILIAVSLWNDETILNYLLEAVFSAMVLILGLEEIKNMKSVERMKRELRVSYLYSQELYLFSLSLKPR